MSKRILLFIGILCGVCSTALSQPLPSGASSSKKATKLFEESLKYYMARDEEKSEELIRKALKEDPAYVDALLLYGEICSIKNDHQAAIIQFEKVIEASPAFSIAYYSLGMEAYALGDYEKALNALQKFMQFTGQKPVQVGRARFMIDNCRFAVQAMKNPVPFNPINLDSSVNTPRDEYFPGITVDEQTLIFTRLLVKNGNATDNKKTVDNPYLLNEDFYISKKGKKGWLSAYNIGDPVNTPGNEGAVTISADGQYLFFTACNREDGYGSCDIYFSYLDGDTWSKPRNIGPPVNTNAWESQPSLSYDGRTLYFSSNRPGGRGDMDLWMTQLENGRWQKPVNLGDVINTPLSEQSPYIHKDNQTLYFSSAGHTGMGNLDLYVCKRAADSSWGVPKNLGYPINSRGDELSLTVAGNGVEAYYASEKAGGKGGLDIYRFELPLSSRAQAVSYVKGVIYDADNKRKLKARIELIDLESGKLLLESYSNRKTGEFIVCLPVNKNYALNVSAEGYLFHSENFSLKSNPANDPFLLDVPMKPIKTGQSVVLRNVFFDTDKFNLKPESKAELDKLIAFLNANPSLKIELGGHTDNQGDKAKNMLLSQNRAKAVLEYLATNGISRERLSAKGYADSQPIAANTDEKGRAQNRRTEFKIVN